MIKQITTGIPGFDAMLYGGFPDKSQVIVAGGPGTGKTLLGFEFLYKNAKAGDKGIFFSLEEDAASIVSEAKEAFGDFKDIDSVIASGNMRVNDEIAHGLSEASDKGASYDFSKMMSDVLAALSTAGATRMVFDSLSLIDLLIVDRISYRKATLSFLKSLKRMGITSLFLSEMPSPERSRLEYKPEFFVFDGVVTMYQSGEELKRGLSIEVIKMRNAKHSFVTTPYDITGNGLRILAAEDITGYG